MSSTCVESYRPVGSMVQYNYGESLNDVGAIEVCGCTKCARQGPGVWLAFHAIISGIILG